MLKSVVFNQKCVFYSHEIVNKANILHILWLH